MTWQALVNRIRADNTSGAAELARAAAMVSLGWIDQTSSWPLPEWKAELSAFAHALYMAQPAMAPLFNLVNQMLLVSESTAIQQEVRPSVRHAIQAFLEQGDQANRRLATATLGTLPRDARVLTFSYSSSVLAVLLEANACQHLSVVFCTESRPVLEGQRLARALTRTGISVEFGVDAAIATLAAQAHVALIGADSITGQGVINKLGTTSLSLICRHVGMPCYVVGDQLKWMPTAAAMPAFSQPKPEAEVWHDPPVGVTISNVYFECTPLPLFSGIIGEVGVRGPEDVLRQLNDMPVAHALRQRLPGTH